MSLTFMMTRVCTPSTPALLRLHSTGTRGVSTTATNSSMTLGEIYACHRYARSQETCTVSPGASGRARSHRRQSAAASSSWPSPWAAFVASRRRLDEPLQVKPRHAVHRCYSSRYMSSGRLLTSWAAWKFGCCGFSSSAGAPKIKIRTSSHQKLIQLYGMNDEVRILIFDDPAELEKPQCPKFCFLKFTVLVGSLPNYKCFNFVKTLPAYYASTGLIFYTSI